MKTTLKLLFMLFAFIPLSGKAQAVLTSIYVDSSEYQVCDSAYYLDFSALTPDLNSFGYGSLVFDGNNYLNTDLIATIDWGDNTTTSHIGTCTSNGTAINWNFPTYHAYNQDGTYTINVTLHDSLTQSSVSTSLTVTVGMCSHSIYAISALDCDNDGIYEGTVNNIPINISNGGNTYTGFYAFGAVQFYGVVPGDYAFEVDPTWLTNSGYILQSITPDSATFGLGTSVQTISINLTCDSSQYSTQCLDGVAFCDANNDGIFDSTTETTLPNAPVSLILPDGNVLIDTTDANGDYSFNYTGLSGPSLIYIDQSWITANGYFPTYFIDTLSNLDCNNNTVVNIPVLCDSTALGTGCINGYLFCDANNNGVLDSSETVLSNAPVVLNSNSTSVTVYTDSLGYFSYSGWQLNLGLVTVSVDQAWLTANGYTSNAIITITAVDCANPPTVYMGINCTNTSNCTDLWTTITPWIGYYQNTTNSIYLSWGNNGQLAPGNYTLTLDFPTGVSPVTSSINNPNYTISGNTITWTLNSTSPWFSTSDVIYFDVPAGIADSTWHLYSATISSTTSDCDSINNYSTLGMLVGVSYDPNDKSVNKPLYVDPAVQDEYTYVVRFQNTGTAPAQDVYILDTLSPNLDWSTLEVIESTHPMQLINYGNGVIRFDYPQIWLPDSTSNEPGSHGHVVYRIKEIQTISIGDIIENTAYIYFDQNAPVITNTTKNINEVLSIDHASAIELSLYPNPTQGIVIIRADGQIKRINILDLSGKTVLSKSVGAHQTDLDLSDLSTGMYAIQVLTEDGQINRMIIKE